MSSPASRVQSLKLGASAQLLPIIAGYGTNLLATPFVVSRLGLHDFGVWAITGAVAQYAALFDLGLSRATNRFVALFHAKDDVKSEGAVVGTCVTALTALGAVLGILTMLSSELVDRVLGTNDPTLARLLMLCAVAIAVIGLAAQVIAAASIGRGRQVPPAIGVAILSILQVIGGVVALVVRPSLKYFALGTVAGSALGLIVLIAIVLFDEHRIVIGRPRAAVAKEILAYGFQAQVVSLGTLLLLQSGKLMAGIIVGPAAAGIYELASRLAMGAQMLGGVSTSALTPHLTRSYIAGGMPSIVAQYEHLTRRNTAVAIFFPFAIAATAFSAIPLWLGNSDDQLVLILIALLPGIAINVSTGVCTSMLFGIGRPAIIAKVTAISGVVQVVFALALGQALGLRGIVAAYAIGLPTVALLSLWRMQSSVGITMRVYFRGAGGPFAIGIFAMVLALPISLLSAPDDRASALLPFLASASLFTAVYALLGWKGHHLPPLPKRSHPTP